MRVTLNLARQPYEDVRSFAARWTLLTVVLALLTGALVFVTFRHWQDTREVVKQIDDRRAQMTAMDRQISSAQAVMNQPANRVVRAQSDFLNQLIARKAFSWTSVFTDLEKMVPTRMHVVSIAPLLDEQNQLELKMTVVGDSREKLIELLQRMESSPQFRSPQLTSESAEQQRLQFQITAVYVPPAAKSTKHQEGD
jgi:type IV pilus assembly protein PilN